MTARWFMGALVSVLAVVVPVAIAPAQSLFTPGQDPIAGARVFGAKGCVKCHAVNGIGGKTGPDLARTERPRSFFDLAAELWNHAPRMAQRMRELGIARPRLEPEETANLVAFLFTLNYFEPAGDVERGRKLFAQKRCILCHQVGGTGGVVGPNLDAVVPFSSPIYLAAAMWNHGPQMAEAMKAKGIARPTFEDRELVDLITFVSRSSPIPPQGPLYVLPGRPQDGRRLFVEKRCADCHSAGGQGGRLGPDLADRAVHRSLTQLAAAMWNKAPDMLAAMKRLAIPVPQLGPEEMADLVGYLYSVRYFAAGGDPGRGAKVLASKGCLGCHALHGERGKPAVDLGQVRGLDAPAAVLSALWNHALIARPGPPAPKAAWSEVRPQEMADLMAYLASLRPGR